MHKTILNVSSCAHLHVDHYCHILSPQGAITDNEFDFHFRGTQFEYRSHRLYIFVISFSLYEANAETTPCK
jgi:hypothetical protein